MNDGMFTTCLPTLPNHKQHQHSFPEGAIIKKQSKHDK